ncbi:MAG: M23 family metallopeptidase [Cyanobacteria bacterium RM1_2_2]|nr:M23 family metallopeptidase [Cyanobacteria bacterium RM1_2_2]
MTISRSLFHPFAQVAQARRLVSIRRIWLSCSLGIVTLLAILIAPALAMQVQVQPTNPQLGDTISVIMSAPVPHSGASSPSPERPTVTLGQKIYPMFAISNNRYRALLPTTPLDSAGTLTLQVNAGGETQNLSVPLRNRQFPTQSIWLGEGGGPEGTDHEFDRVDAFKALVTPEKLWNGPFLRPNQGEITTVYGVQRYYNGEFAEDYYHRGVDYAAGIGSPVVTPAAGRIALVGRVEDGFELHGNTIGIDHGQGVLSIMIHLSRIDVKEGDMVQAGQRIGAVGSTGISTGPHLHWGLYVNGQSVDPVPWRYAGFE